LFDLSIRITNIQPFEGRTVSEEPLSTQLWLGGMRVEFIRWTNSGVIYARVGSQETLANLTRSTVRRLLKEGMLVIEGYRPDWATPEENDPKI
jgi:hypothetical protein